MGFDLQSSVATSASYARSRRFIGRSAELDAFDAARRELNRGRGSLLLVDGEAGIGKSRIVAHALRAVSGGRASRIYGVECVAESTAELAPIRACLASIWTGDLTNVPPLAQRAVAQLITDTAGPELVGRFAGATLGKTELFAGLIGALTAAGAKRGTILVLEDIHWADRTSLEFLAALAARIDAMRLLVIATCRIESFERSDALADVLSRLLRGNAVRRLSLQPLSRSEVRELIADALADRTSIAAPTITAIVERSEGNPFFAEELLKAALDRRGANEQLPLSIRAGIRHRLAVLKPAHRSLLDVAAVLGVRFDHALLAGLTARPPEAVLRMLHAARDAGLVDEDGDTFRFHHALTRETIYDGLLKARARALHRRVLDVLEANAADTDWKVEALAYHAWQAGDAASTLRYSERAGDRALQRGSYADARSYYQRIVDAPDPAARARLHERLGAIATAQGDFPAAMRALETAFAIRIRGGELDDAARIVVALAVEQSNSGIDPAPGLEAFLEQHGTALGDLARDNTLVFLARMLTSLGQFARAGELLGRLKAVELLEPRVRANEIICRLNMSEYRGSADTWRTAAREMLALAPDLPPLMRAVSLTTVAQTGAWLGEGAIARAAIDDAQATATQWGFEGLLVFTCAVQGLLAFLAGDLVAARRALDAVARRPDVTPAGTVALRVGPFVAAALADAALAERYLGAASGESSAGDDEEDALFVTAGRLSAGSRTPATDRTRLIELLESREPDALLPSVVAVAAAQHLDLNALDALTTIMDAPANRRNPASAATRDLVAALVAQRTGHPAGPAARRAEAAFERVGWPRFAELARSLAAVRAPAAVPALLTARETQIAELIAEGETNAAIAERLDIGVKTVEKRVTSILAKLGARSRARIAAFIAKTRDADASSPR